MQTIIKELAFNPAIQEMMLNADITQVINQTWFQILCSGAFGSMLGGGISGYITYRAMKKVDSLNNDRWEKDNSLNQQRWEKSKYKDYECEFWLHFYKEFHIVCRFVKPFLHDMIFSNLDTMIPKLAHFSEDNGKKYFNKWMEHLDNIFDTVNGYEDLFLSKRNFNTTHIWILWSIRGILHDNIDNDNLRFDNHAMLDIKLYRSLYQDFQYYYMNNVRLNNSQVNDELNRLWDSEQQNFDLDRIWKYFEQKLDEMEGEIKIIINGDITE